MLWDILRPMKCLLATYSLQKRMQVYTFQIGQAAPKGKGSWEQRVTERQAGLLPPQQEIGKFRQPGSCARDCDQSALV